MSSASDLIAALLSSLGGQVAGTATPADGAFQAALDEASSEAGSDAGTGTETDLEQAEATAEPAAVATRDAVAALFLTPAMPVWATDTIPPAQPEEASAREWGLAPVSEAPTLPQTTPQAAGAPEPSQSLTADATEVAPGPAPDSVQRPQEAQPPTSGSSIKAFDPGVESIRRRPVSDDMIEVADVVPAPTSAPPSSTKSESLAAEPSEAPVRRAPTGLGEVQVASGKPPKPAAEEEPNAAVVIPPAGADFTPATTPQPASEVPRTSRPADDAREAPAPAVNSSSPRVQAEAVAADAPVIATATAPPPPSDSKPVVPSSSAGATALTSDSKASVTRRGASRDVPVPARPTGPPIEGVTPSAEPEFEHLAFTGRVLPDRPTQPAETKESSVAQQSPQPVQAQAGRNVTAEPAHDQPEVAPTPHAPQNSREALRSRHPEEPMPADRANAAAVTAPEPSSASRQGISTEGTQGATVSAVPAQESGTARTERPVEPHRPGPVMEARSPEMPAAPNRPVEHISYTVSTGENGSRAQVRITQKDGAIEMAVRAPSPEAAQAIRSALPELQTNLEASGFRSEIRTPFFESIHAANEARHAASDNRDGNNPGRGKQSEWTEEDGRRHRPRKDDERNDDGF